MNTEERALLELRISDLKRTIHTRKFRFDLRGTTMIFLYAAAVSLMSYNTASPFLPIFVFLAGCVVAYTASADIERRVSQKIDTLLEIEDIKERIKNENGA